MNPVLEFVGYLGGAAVVVGGLSSWIGKIYADRVLQTEQSKHNSDLKTLESELRQKVESRILELNLELAMFRDKTLKAHNDKLSCYASAIDGVAGFMAKISSHSNRMIDAVVLQRAFIDFDSSRIMNYGHMILFAPQNVIDAYDALVEYFLECAIEGKQFSWKDARSMSLNFINAARLDIGINPSPVQYNGKR